MSLEPQGFREFLKTPLIDTIFQCRTRLVSRGVKSVRVGSLPYESDSAEPRPLTPWKRRSSSL